MGHSSEDVRGGRAGDAPNETDARALFASARAGREAEVVALLDQRRVSVDSLDPHGNSLLMLAAYHGHPSLVRTLLERGANPNGRNERGQSPLEAAAFLGDVETVHALVDGGAIVDARSASGRTPLMWAAAFGRLGAVRALLGRGADARLEDEEGLDARARARAAGADEVVDVLTVAMGARAS